MLKYKLMTAVAGLSLMIPLPTLADVTAPDVDAFMDELITTLDVVPGYAIAIVKGDEILLSKGYGELGAESNAPFGPDSQVYIASSTKSLTGLAARLLEAKGLLDFNLAIENYLVELKGTPAGAVTLNELLSHTHGLSENALTWRTAFTGDHDREILISLTSKMPQENYGTYAYSNTGYVIASLVIEAVTGKSWKQVVEDEVLDPLGMNRTTAYVSKLDAGAYALPHSWFGKKNQMPMTKKDSSMHAAGGHYSTANDMTRWLKAQLNNGLVDGVQVFPAEIIQKSHHAIAELEADFYTYKREKYATGWYIADYKGYEMFHHFGSFAGYRTHVSFIPALDVGVAVMSNDASRPSFNLPDLIANYIYDMAAGLENAGADQRAEISQIAQMVAPMVGREMPQRPRNAPENEASYVGQFFNENLGTFEFAMEEDELVVRFGNLYSKTTYKEDGAVRMELVPGNGTLGVFVADEEGTVTSFRYRGDLFLKTNP